MAKQKFFKLKDDYTDPMGCFAPKDTILLLGAYTLNKSEFWGWYYDTTQNFYEHLVVGFDKVDPIDRSSIDPQLRRDVVAAAQSFYSKMSDEEKQLIRTNF